MSSTIRSQSSATSDVVIRVENLTKEYRLGTINRGTLHQDLQSWWARKRGKEDPNSSVLSSQSSTLNPRLLALEDVSFVAKSGEVLGIIGRNGAGKSTLLKILSRVTAPTRGTVKIRGRIASLLEVGTGFHPELTGRENVYLNGTILGMTKKEIDNNFDEIVAFSEIETFIDTPVKRYSSGMHVRLAFAVAAHLEPEILVIDEVLAVGDVQFQKKCIDKMETVKEEGRTVLVVSHNMGVIRNLCSRAILLKNGCISAEGNVIDVINVYTEVDAKAGKTSCSFSDNPGTPLFIKRVAIVNENGIPQHQFSLREKIIIEIDYVVRKNVAQGIVLFTISRGGIYIFQCHDTDLKPECLSSRKPGVYRSRIQLPQRFLIAGIYSITFSAAIGSTGQYGHDGHPDALSFVVSEEGENIFHKSYAEHRGMLVICELDWQTEKIE